MPLLRCRQTFFFTCLNLNLNSSPAELCCNQDSKHSVRPLPRPLRGTHNTDPWSAFSRARYIKATKRWRRPWGKTDTLNCPRVAKHTIFVFSPVSPNFLFSHFFWIIAHNLLTQLWALREWLKECLTRRVSPLTSLGWSRRSDGALMNGCAATIRTFVRGRKFAHKSAANCKPNLFRRTADIYTTVYALSETTFPNS